MDISILATLLGPLSATINLIRPPLRVRVLSLEFRDTRPRPGDSIIVVTGYPISYAAELEITNKSSRPVFIDEIVLQLDSEPEPRKGQLDKTIGIESGEPKDVYAHFPLSEQEQPATASPYTLRVVPTVGRLTKTKGDFPVLAQS